MGTCVHLPPKMDSSTTASDSNSISSNNSQTDQPNSSESTDSSPVSNDTPSPSTKEYTFNDLPDEIILEILNLLAQPNTSSTQFGDLPYHDFLDASIINKRVYRISYDPSK